MPGSGAPGTPGGPDGGGPDGPGTDPQRGMLRPVLWTGLVISAAANALLSGTGASVPAGIGCGLLTLACATALVVHHYRNRRG
ncbi:hypothetical protein DVA86_26470 [Streptomyces armeniacus]|uniref:Uncharacterized protein n=1 Tax=Streptomyces armeniacus TaxID=83291 RepID=A0A345XVI9_9ACTN|nr:hypothetical protein [Streptomyces armeniacus]AXK35655.1 hypothetical protein DVA86_26470 [Streptomyces armeniacus]